jgi:hypothetical protein
MKNALLLSLLFLVFTSNLFSQKSKYAFEIDLEKEILTGVYFNFEIIDLRQRTDFLGNIYKGTSNRLMESKLENGAEFQFNNIIKRSNKFHFQHQDSFALVIKELRVLEETEPDQASLNVFFEFYKVENDQYFKVHEFDGFYFYKIPFVHQYHAGKITTALQEATVEFQLYSNSKLLPELENGLSKNDLLNQKVNYNYDILKTYEYEKGFYRTYADFLNNTPSKKENIEIDFEGVQPYRTNILRYDFIISENDADISPTEKRNMLDKVWGFSDGKDLYFNNVSFNNGQFFSRIESKGEYCYFYSIDKSARNFYFTAIAGIPGFIISNNIKSNHQAPLIFDLKNQNTFPISIHAMGLMLRSDLETVNAYKAERKRGKKAVQFKYIDNYNLKNREKFIEEMTSPKN